MRRSVPAVVITLVGLGALASFKSSPAVPTKAAGAAIKTPATSAAPPATAPPASSPDTSPATSPAPAGGTSPATAPPATKSASTRTVDGDPFDNQYGTVQIRVTLRGSQITDVQALQMPFDHERSAEISQEAEPMLRDEVLQAQSAQIDIISGATFTSESYAQSLQSALDKAHA